MKKNFESILREKTKIQTTQDEAFYKKTKHFWVKKQSPLTKWWVPIGVGALILFITPFIKTPEPTNPPVAKILNEDFEMIASLDLLSLDQDEWDFIRDNNNDF
tara:strand:- start:2428 stop:2736 length:309 start_codon:yes stop_codon:yes gene_type:complete